MSRLPLFWFLLTGCLALDQGVKAWVRGSMAVNQSLDAPWPNVFEIKRVTNEGIAFGMFQGAGVLLAPIAIGIAIFAIFYAHKHPRDSGWTHAAMSLLCAGALGNLYDRLFMSGVTDMFWFRLIDFPVFNIADVCITFATIILIVKWGLEAVFHKEPIAAPASSQVWGAEPENVSTNGSVEPSVLPPFSPDSASLVTANPSPRGEGAGGEGASQQAESAPLLAENGEGASDPTPFPAQADPLPTEDPSPWGEASESRPDGRAGSEGAQQPDAPSEEPEGPAPETHRPQNQSSS